MVVPEVVGIPCHTKAAETATDDAAMQTMETIIKRSSYGSEGAVITREDGYGYDTDTDTETCGAV